MHSSEIPPFITPTDQGFNRIQTWPNICTTPSNLSLFSHSHLLSTLPILLQVLSQPRQLLCIHSLHSSSETATQNEIIFHLESLQIFFSNSECEKFISIIFNNNYFFHSLPPSPRRHTIPSTICTVSLNVSNFHFGMNYEKNLNGKRVGERRGAWVVGISF